MRKYIGLATAAALAIGGFSLVGCQPNNGGMTGGGTTDTYGTGPNARYEDTGNTGATLRPGTANGANGTMNTGAPAVSAPANAGGAAAGGNAATGSQTGSAAPNGAAPANTGTGNGGSGTTGAGSGAGAGGPGR